MALITLPDATLTAQMAQRSSFQTQARGIDGTDRFAGHKLHGTDGTDHLSRRKLGAQMAQITLLGTTSIQSTDGKMICVICAIFSDTSFTSQVAQIILPDTSSMTQIAPSSISTTTTVYALLM